MNPYKELWKAFIWYNQILYIWWAMGDIKYNQNVIFIKCGTCGKQDMNIIIQKEGMSFTCSFCGHLVSLIKKHEFDKLLSGLEEAASIATTDKLS